MCVVFLVHILFANNFNFLLNTNDNIGLLVIVRMQIQRGLKNSRMYLEPGKRRNSTLYSKNYDILSWKFFSCTYSVQHKQWPKLQK